MKWLFLILLFPLTSQACDINQTNVREDIIDNVRSLFKLETLTPVFFTENINDLEVPREKTVAHIEHVMDEKIFDRENPEKCLRFIQIYRVYTHDPFRECNGIMKSELKDKIHEVIYRNCSITGR